MRTIIKYNRLFIFTENASKSFYTEFLDEINIIYGANTSGKSTVIQAINYTFGINDEKYKLAEILEEKPIFRVDFSVFYNQEVKHCIIIRDDDFVYIKVNDAPVIKFQGITGNNSTEHIKLKKYISELFYFRLKLNSKGNEVEAPLEAMFLPYYVAQDYGWILPLKSFKNFEYYKGFKESYYDYYFGVLNPLEDKTEKYKLEEDKKELQSELDVLNRIKQSREDLVYAQNNDELFVQKAIDYVSKYNKNRKVLIQNESRCIVLASQLRYHEERLAVLRKTQKTLKDNTYSQKRCPVCNQEMQYTLTEKYIYFQNQEDTSTLIETTKKEIAELRSKLNKQKNTIEKTKIDLENNYNVLESYNTNGLSMNDWIKNKASIQILETIQDKENGIQHKLQEVTNRLKMFKTDESIKQDRKKKSDEFNRLFLQDLKMLNVKIGDFAHSPYELSVFRQQGVELLKTVLSYHFAFNKLIDKTDNIHKLPLCLDAIFKEDVDATNKELIISFISKNLPSGTQLICSVAESSLNETVKKNSVIDYNEKFFNNSATLIKTGDTARSLLKDFDSTQMPIFEESISIMTS